MADQELQATPKQHVESPEGEVTHEGTYFVPAVDIYENSKELVLLADMPESLRGCGS
jgi:HSP20 family molecular chaperone IbpA